MREDAEIVIDGLQYSNWSETIFRQMRRGGVTAVHATIAYHENFRETVANIERWNRWYDLEHTPPNVALDGVMLSRRYVAPPALHAARVTAADSPFAGGRCTFLTTYVLTGDPAVAFDAMSTTLPKLYDAGRMTFPAEKKVVRDGDVFVSRAAASAPAIGLPANEVAFVGHTGLIVVQRRGVEDAYRARAEKLVTLDGVQGVWSLESKNRPGLGLDLVFVEGDPAAVAEDLRGGAPHPTGADVVVDAPYLLINPLHYPWADDIRNSDLPPTIA